MFFYVILFDLMWRQSVICSSHGRRKDIFQGWANENIIGKYKISKSRGPWSPCSP